MVRFVHTADIHFGMENYGHIDPSTGIHTRLIDFEKALQFCINFAIAEQVDLFIFSGDAYKTAHPTPTHQRMLLNCFLRLFEHNIPIVMVVGNHDHTFTFGKAHALDLFKQIPCEGFYVLDKPKSLLLSTKSGPVQIVGIPWPSRSSMILQSQHVHRSSSELVEYISENIGYIIKDFAQKLDPTLPAILMGHLTVSTGIFSGSEKRAIYGTDPIFLPSQLAITPFDYVALGHLHRHQNLHQGNPPVVYSGSIERIDFGERNEQKGFCLVSIESKQHTTYQFIEVPVRPFFQIELFLEGDKSQTEQIIKKIKQYDITQAVVKIVYHLAQHMVDKVDVVAIQNVCAIAHHLVGIFPIKQVDQRLKRHSITIDMSMEKILDSYFSTRSELSAEKKSMLVKKALLLEQETVSEG